jgi:hypothetical protein
MNSGAILFQGSMYPPHPRYHVSEPGLILAQPARGLDLLARKDRHALPHHLRGDGDGSPSYQVRHSLGQSMKRSRVIDHHEPAPARHLSGPAHAAIRPEQPLVPVKGEQSRIYYVPFLPCHAGIIGKKVRKVNKNT